MDARQIDTIEENSNMQLVTFRLGINEYGIDIMQAKEIIKMEKITIIPNAPEYVEGVINLRGNVIPIVDLKKRFVLEESDGEKNTGIIIVNVHGIDMGIIIDSISKVVSIDDENIQATPHMFSGVGHKYIRGVAKLDEKLLVILELSQLLEEEEQEKEEENI